MIPTLAPGQFVIIWHDDNGAHIWHSNELAALAQDMQTAVTLAAVGLALYWRWADAQRGRARVIDMPQQMELFTQERLAS